MIHTTYVTHMYVYMYFNRYSICSNIGFQGVSFGGYGTVFCNATTVPTSNPTGGGLLYCSGGALKFRGSSGTVTTIAAA